MQKKAFTLIELLITTTIIILLSSSRVLYFNDFTLNFSIKSDISTLEDKLQNLEKDIKNKKIYDYELNFVKNNNYFTGYINNYDIENNVIFDSFSSGTGTLKIKTPNSWSFESKIFAEDKLLEDKFLVQNETLIYDLSPFSTYRFENYLSDSIVNDVYFAYFSSKKDLELIWIFENNNKTWTQYNNLVIKNILWKKEILLDWTHNLDEVYLFFERADKEYFLKINK